MDDEQISVRVPTTDDADVGILRVEHKVAWYGLLPGDRRTIAVLHGRTAAVTDYICNGLFIDIWGVRWYNRSYKLGFVRMTQMNYKVTVVIAKVRE